MSDEVSEDFGEEEEIVMVPQPTVIDLHLPPEGTGPIRLDLWLARQMPALSRSRVQALLRTKNISAEGVELHAKDHTAGPLDIRVVLPPPAPTRPQPENIPLDILYEDKDCFVINKPAGLVVHPGPGHPNGTLVNALLFHCHDLMGVGGFERPGIVHRLDKDTSGLMVAAKTDAAMHGFARLFANGGIRKEYVCLVHGRPPKAEGTIQTLIGRHPVLRQRWAVVERNGKLAITHWQLERELGPIALLRVKIDTGRTHQIRIHCAALGCPIVGDPFYGRSSADAKLSPVPLRQMLHSTRIVFRHPVTGAPMEFNAPPPEDFQAYLVCTCGQI